MRPTIEPRDACYLVAQADAMRDDDFGHSLVNIGDAKMPEGLEIQSVGPHRFVARRDLAFYGTHGHVRPQDPQ